MFFSQIRNVVLVSITALGILVSSVTPANAQGSGTQPCHQLFSFAGRSDQTHAATWQQDVSACGNVGVRVAYTTYPGSGIFYSSYSYGSLIVRRAHPNPVGGHHKVTAPGKGYNGSFYT